MKKSINFFETKKVTNTEASTVAGRQIETNGGGFVDCNGNSYAYASDVRHTNWIFADTITYNWVGGNP